MTATLLSPSTVPTRQPAITIVVAPRESFSYTQQALDSIYKHTKIPFKLVYVDGGSPRHIQKYLVKTATKKGFTLLRTEHFLSPNQARNLGLSQVTTEYVVFIDNDIHVSTGWLENLWCCAQETNAAVVCPLTCTGKPLHDRIHSAGGEARIFMDIKGDRIRRRLHEKRFLVNRSVATFKHQLYRRSCEFVELRCILVKQDIFDQIGPLDEKLLSTQEDMDFSLRVNQAKGQMFCETAAVVTHVPQTSYRWADFIYFMLRWSDNWEVESLTHFQQKWDLDMDEYFLQRYKQLGHRRQQAFLYPLLRQLTRGHEVNWLKHIAVRLEQWLNQIIADRHAQRPINPVKTFTPTTTSTAHKTSSHKVPQQSIRKSHNPRRSYPRLMTH